MMTRHTFFYWLVAAAVLILTGCAATPHPDTPQDPWENFNRRVYTFNDTLDRAVFHPIAVGYTKVVPQPVRNCIHNSFNNLKDVWAGINSLLQGRGRDGINTFGRFLLNTTMGVGGCWDVATANGAARIPNDFGTTLGVWGVQNGPYLFLPFWGASTVRDTFGLLGDGLMTSDIGGLHAITAIPVRNSLYGVQAIDTRAYWLKASDLVDQIALDPYSFIRDAYLQHRDATVKRKKGEREDASTYNDALRVNDEASLANEEASPAHSNLPTPHDNASPTNNMRSPQDSPAPPP